MGFIGEIIGGIIGAGISGGIAIYISQKSIKQERKERDNEKLQDRKQFWLKKHYIYIQENIKSVTNNIQINNTMIYNRAVETNIDSASKQGMYKMTIINKLEPLAKGNINEHLKPYEFYENLMNLYNEVEKYKTNLEDIYSEFLRFTQITLDKYFNGSVKPRAYTSSPVEIYDVAPMFYSLVYSVFTKNDYKIVKNPDQTIGVEYSNGGSNPTIFISKSNKNADIFAKSVMPLIISYFNDKLMSLEKQSTEIEPALKNIIPKLLKIIGDYNSGIPIKGECKNCKSIKDITKLDELMPPN